MATQWHTRLRLQFQKFGNFERQRILILFSKGSGHAKTFVGLKKLKNLVWHSHNFLLSYIREEEYFINLLHAYLIFILMFCS